MYGLKKSCERAYTLGENTGISVRQPPRSCGTAVRQKPERARVDFRPVAALVSDALNERVVEYTVGRYST